MRNAARCRNQNKEKKMEIKLLETIGAIMFYTSATLLSCIAYIQIERWLLY